MCKFRIWRSLAHSKRKTVWSWYAPLCRISNRFTVRKLHFEMTTTATKKKGGPKPTDNNPNISEAVFQRFRLQSPYKCALDRGWSVVWAHGWKVFLLWSLSDVYRETTNINSGSGKKGKEIWASDGRMEHGPFNEFAEFNEGTAETGSIWVGDRGDQKR